MSASGIDLKSLWRPLLIVGAMVFLYATVLSRLVDHWLTDENYSHGLLVPFIIAYIVWTNFDRIKESITNPSIVVGAGCVLFSLLALLAGTLGAELFVQRISLVLMIAGILIYFFGAKILKALSIPFVLLLLAVPIPQIIFNKIAFPLQIYASQIAVWGIRSFEVPTVRKGNVIEILPTGATQVIALEVVEACSGIRSLMTLMTLGLILAYFTRRSSSRSDTDSFLPIHNPDFWRGAILVFSAIPIAIITNAGRVTATGVMTYLYGKRATESLVHDFAGWIVYVIALILLILLNFALMRVFDRFVPKVTNE